MDNTDDLYIQFKKSDYGENYKIINQDEFIGVYENVLYVFDGFFRLSGRFPFDKIEFILQM